MHCRALVARTLTSISSIASLRSILGIGRRGRPRGIASFVVLPTLLLTFVRALRLALLFLRVSLALRRFVLSLRPWCLLLTLGSALLWRRGLTLGLLRLLGLTLGLLRLLGRTLD